MKPTVRVAVPLVTTAAPADCAHSPSTAAIVGGRVISRTEVTETVDSCRKTDLQIKRLDVLSPLILREIADETSPKLEWTINTAKLRVTMEVDPDASQALGTPYQKVVEGELKMGHLWASVDVEVVLQELPRMETNPRCGAWSPHGIDYHGSSISTEVKS